MGWDNPPVPWRELERRLSWRTDPAENPPAPTPAPAAAKRRPATPPAGPAWAELHCHSSYSFLDGASSPAELVAAAAERGLTALALTDHDGMYGVPQFAQAAARLRAEGGALRTVFGAELSLPPSGSGEVRRPGAARAGAADPPG